MGKRVDLTRGEPGLLDPQVINPGPEAPVPGSPGQPLDLGADDPPPEPTLPTPPPRPSTPPTTPPSKD